MNNRLNQQDRELILAECRKMIETRLGSTNSLCNDVDIRNSLVELRKEFERSQTTIQKLSDEIASLHHAYKEVDADNRLLELSSKQTQCISDVSLLAKRQAELVKLGPRVDKDESNVSSLGKQISNIESIVNDLQAKHKATASSISKLLNSPNGTVETQTKTVVVEPAVVATPQIPPTETPEFIAYKEKIEGELSNLTKKIDTIISIAAPQAALNDQMAIVQLLKDQIAALDTKISAPKIPKPVAAPVVTSTTIPVQTPAVQGPTVAVTQPQIQNNLEAKPEIKSNLPPGLIFGAQ